MTCNLRSRRPVHTKVRGVWPYIAQKRTSSLHWRIVTTTGGKVGKNNPDLLVSYVRISISMLTNKRLLTLSVCLPLFTVYLFNVFENFVYLLRHTFPTRFRLNGLEFAVPFASGVYPGVQDMDCVRNFPDTPW